MEIHAGKTGEVRGEDVFHHLGIGDIGGTLVVNHEVVALRIGGVRVRRKSGAGRLVGGVHVVDDDIGARFETVFQEVFLRDVIVAATTGEEQNLERLGRGGGGGETGKREGGDEGKTAE